MASGKAYPSAETLYRIGWAASRLAAALDPRYGKRDLAAVFKADEALWRLVAQVEPADPLEGAPHADKLRKQEANWARALGLEPQAPRPRTAKTLSGWPPNVNDALAHVRSVAVRIHQAILAFDPDDPAKEWSWPGLYEVGLFARSAQVLSSAGYKAKVPAAAAKPTARPKTPGRALPADKTEQGEGLGGANALPESRVQREDEDNRYAKRAKLAPAVRKAYLSFLYAEARNEKRLEDREAYDWLREHGIDPAEEESGELADYKLPAFDTWSRHLRTARKAVGEQKYTPRRARPTGHSSVRSGQI